jgi:hypothetical protein
MTPQTHDIPASGSYSSARRTAHKISLAPVPIPPDTDRPPLRSLPVGNRDWRQEDPLLSRIDQGWR